MARKTYTFNGKTYSTFEQMMLAKANYERAQKKKQTQKQPTKTTKNNSYNTSPKGFYERNKAKATTQKKSGSSASVGITRRKDTRNNRVESNRTGYTYNGKKYNTFEQMQLAKANDERAKRRTSITQSKSAKARQQLVNDNIRNGKPINTLPDKKRDEIEKLKFQRNNKLTAEESRKLKEARVAQYNGTATKEQIELLKSSEAFDSKIGNIGRSVNTTAEREVGGIVRYLASGGKGQALDMYSKGQISRNEYNEFIKTGKISNPLNDFAKTLNKGKEQSEKLDEYGKGLIAEADKQKLEAEKNMSSGEKFISETLSSIYRQALDSLTGNAWFVPMAASVFGESKDTVKNIGGSEDKDVANALWQTIDEVGQEFLFSGFGPLSKFVPGIPFVKKIERRIGEFIGDKVFKNIESSMLRNALESIAYFGKGIIEENLEEIIGMKADIPVSNAIYGDVLAKQGLENEANQFFEMFNKLAIENGGSAQDVFNAFAATLQSNGFLEKEAQKYIDKGASKEDAYSVAEDTKNMILAKISGDKKTANALKQKILKVTEKYNPYEKEFDVNELMETIALTTASTALMGTPAVISRNQFGKNVKNAEAEGKNLKEQLGFEGFNSLLNNLLSSEDSNTASRAQAVKDYVEENGIESIPNGQVYDLAQSFYKDNNLKAEKINAARDVIKREVSRNGNYKNIDSETRNRIAEQTLEDIEAVGVNIDEKGTDLISKAVLNYRTGEITIDDLNTLSTENSVNREVFNALARMEGKKELPIILNKDGSVNSAETNKATNDYLIKNSIANAIDVAEVETKNWVDKTKGASSARILNKLGTNGVNAYNRVIDNESVKNPSKFQQNQMVFEQIYDFAVKGKVTYQEIMQSDNPFINSVDKEIREAAFKAGIQDRIISETGLYRGMQVMANEKISTPVKKNSANNLYIDTDRARSSVIEATTLFSEVTGTPTHLVDGIPEGDTEGNFNDTFKGMYDPNSGEVYISVDNEFEDVSKAVMHEYTHSLQVLAPNEYKKYKEYIKNEIISSEKYGQKYLDNIIQQRIKGYAKKNIKLTEETALDEIVADMSGEFLRDKSFADRIAEENPTLGRAVIDSIRSVLHKIRTMLSINTRDNTFAYALLSELDMFKEAERLWLEAAHVAAKKKADDIAAENNAISYESLVRKDPVKIVKVKNNENIKFDDRKMVKKAVLKKIGKQSGTDVQGRNTLYSEDVQRNIVVGRQAIEHGLERNFENNAFVALNLPEYIKNAIKINNLNELGTKGTKDYRANGYILLGIGKDKNNNLYPAYFVVNTLESGIDEIVEFDNLSAINSKKISEAGNTARHFQVATSDVITVSDLLDLVNKNFSDVLPSSVAMHYGNTRKNTKLNKSVVYSIIEDSQGRELSSEQQEFFANVDSHLLDENGRLKRYYHGTQRADRVGTIFDPNRATSGPMSYFTDSKEIATNYSRSKSDTSIAYDEDEPFLYANQFRTKKEGTDGKGAPLTDMWYKLSAKARSELAEKAGHISIDYDSDDMPFVYDENNTEATGAFSRQLQDYRGNVLKALNYHWLDAGNLFGEEPRYLELLNMLGINDYLKEIGYEPVKYFDPNYREEKVYEVYLNVMNPVVTEDLSVSDIKKMKKWAETLTQEDIESQYGYEDWNHKNSETPEEWIAELEKDIENNTTYAWTRIPDLVTEYFKNEGYDGFVDLGGKNGGDEHQVVIPFYSEQVKNIDNENPTNNPDIRYSISTEDEIFDLLGENQEEYNPDAELPYENRLLEESRQRRVNIREEVKTYGEKNHKQTVLTHELVLNEGSVRNACLELVKDVMRNSEYVNAQGRKAQYSSKVLKFVLDSQKKMWEQYMQGKYDDMFYTAFDTAAEMIENITLIDDNAFNTYKEFRDYFRSQPIYVPDNIKSDFSKGYGAFRSNNFNKLVLTNNASNQTIDMIWDEIVERFGGIVDMDLEHPVDMLEEIANTWDSLQNYTIAYESEEAYAVIKSVAEDLLDICMDQGKAWQSFADKKKTQYNEQTKRLKERHREAIRDLRIQHKEKIVEIKKYHKEKEEQRKSRQIHKETYGNIKDNYNWLVTRLLKPTDDKHIPEHFKDALAEVLVQMDMQSENSKKLETKRGIKAQKTIQLDVIKNQLEAMCGERQDALIEKVDGFEYDGYVFELIDALNNKLKVKTIDTLNESDLKAVDVLLSYIRNGINNYNKAFDESIKENIAKLGQKTIEACDNTIKRRGNKKLYKNSKGGNTARGFIEDILNYSEVTPIDFFEDNKGGLGTCYKALRLGFDKYERNIRFIKDEIFGPIFGKYANNKFLNLPLPGSQLEQWSDSRNARTFVLESGEKVDLTPSQVMTLYCTASREAAKMHIYINGIIPSETNSLKKLKLINKGTEVNVTPVIPSANDVQNICNSLTTEQKDICNKIKAVLNTSIADLGNETSMLLYGYKKFVENDYFPIAVSRAYVDTNFDADTKSYERIRNFGFTKSLVPNANNPIIIGDFFEIISDHCSKMAMYNAYTAPLADIERVLNYKPRTDGGRFVASVEGKIENAYGSQAMSYIRNFIDDIEGNNKMREDGLRSFANTLLGNYKKYVVGANIRVFLQQPTAVARAWDLINPKYFVSLDSLAIKKNMKEMKEHCPIAEWKAWGNYQIDMSKDLGDIIMNKDWSILDKLTMDIYGAADNYTWAKIWAAVKNEVKSTHKGIDTSSQEFWDLCNERASEIFDKTQVVDSPFHRSNAMREQDLLNKITTSFMAEPTRTFNMVRTDILRAKQSLYNGDTAKAAKILSRMTSVYIINVILVTMAQSLGDVIRDDDEEKDKAFVLRWVDRFLNNLLGITVENGNIDFSLSDLVAGNIWFHNNIYIANQLASWGKYGTSITAYESLEMSTKNINDWEKYFTGESKKTIKELVEESAYAIGALTGVPTKSALRDTKAVFGAIFKVLGIDFETFAADGSEEQENIFKKFGVEDGSSFDNFLNHFGINLTDEEKAEREFNSRVKELKSKSEGLTGEELDKQLWSSVNEGINKTYLPNCDIDAIENMRKLYLAAGGNPKYVNKVLKEGVSREFKKTIGVLEKESEMRKFKFYLQNTLGVSDAELSHDIVYKSETATKLKAAFLINDHEMATEAINALVAAGLRGNDYIRIWDYRKNHGDLSKYIPQGSTGSYIWPVGGTVDDITSAYGYRDAPTAGASTNHQGIDIGARSGSNVAASDGGEVIYADYNGGLGYTVKIQHEDGTITQYSHLKSYDVYPGDIVFKSQTIGKVGSTGTSTGPHLHFAVIVNGEYVNPINYLNN